MKQSLVKRVIVALNCWRLIIPALLYLTDKDFRDIIAEDLPRHMYSESGSTVSLYWFCHALVFRQPFRAVCYLRMRNGGHNTARQIQEIVMPNAMHIEVTGDIGPGLVIYHGHDVILHCDSAGKNLAVYQMVTVGRNPSRKRGERDIPVFGDDVTIYTHSVVVGGITVGNNVTIAAGAIVLGDIPDNCVVAGNPARIVKREGLRVDEPLAWNKDQG
ncbi:hypothetical protein [Bifidobacterium sp. SO4]|uniref:hypothetical protein n=1 Tax=Bifidobacterium sp. SO4 TaxID=2809030 RepID=UPI001BDCCBEE|nr:hypothetical protein [Bifidobacterium sp. SO4]MBT1169959.1 hypothetical protein [Bifidobacterium sp. SO4]